ncbi:MAG: TIGR03905 family TSCPD domain-containing protein [Candidatus Limivicinus sp.]
MKFSYRPKGVCSQRMDIEIEDNKVVGLKVLGGCDGNLKGIGRLIEGMDVDEVIGRLEGIRCGFKSTSCPDQLAKALKEYKEELA